jgi:hypothetical protein
MGYTRRTFKVTKLSFCLKEPSFSYHQNTVVENCCLLGIWPHNGGLKLIFSHSSRYVLLCYYQLTPLTSHFHAEKNSLDLPMEIRFNIYSEVLVQPTNILLWGDKNCWHECSPDPIYVHPQLLRVNKQIHREASYLLLSHARVRSEQLGQLNLTLRKFVQNFLMEVNNWKRIYRCFNKLFELF